MPATIGPEALKVRRAVHTHLMHVEEHIDRLRFNTAIAEIRKLSNDLISILSEMDQPADSADLKFAFREAADVLVLLFSPMMPHLAEDCWALIGHTAPVSESTWPSLDRSLTISESITLPVQVNGKKRAELTIAADADSKAIELEAVKLEGVLRALEGRPVRKVIVVPQRIVNVVG